MLRRVYLDDNCLAGPYWCVSYWSGPCRTLLCLSVSVCLCAVMQSVLLTCVWSEEVVTCVSSGDVSSCLRENFINSSEIALSLSHSVSSCFALAPPSLPGFLGFPTSPSALVFHCHSFISFLLLLVGVFVLVSCVSAVIPSLLPLPLCLYMPISQPLLYCFT